MVVGKVKKKGVKKEEGLLECREARRALLDKSWMGLGGAGPEYLELAPRGSKSSKRLLISHQ